MSLHTLALDSKPIDIALSKSGNRLAVLSNSDLAVYAVDLHKRPIPKPSLLWRSDAIKDHSPRHIAFLGEDRMFVLTDSWDEEESSLWRSEGDMLLPQGPIMEAESASLLFSNVDQETLYIQFENGALHQVVVGETTSDLAPQTPLVNKFPSFAPEVQIIDVESQVHHHAIREIVSNS
jgi:elongator complex protein 1